jgi:hypothetical protein
LLFPDHEVLLPWKPLLQPLLLLELFTFNIREVIRRLRSVILTAQGRFSKRPLGSVNPLA